ncbi:Nop53 (60S ribosomal biogenesis) [Trypanosoma brucei equiperdum]|uniref:Ribosome biogenesis protein NOP53 n=1 Tax=Trypanosoma brucei equiperdum TaxID=630700 RepID=A0A3L6L0F2_9TRYP|nr:Nop53 (60S ribosomal biogenesis) [Trypanosoma brucei equiperdum]
MSKLRDLWSGADERAVNAPKPVRTSRGWNVPPEVLPAKPQAPRKRKCAYVRPNNRAAVALPHPGQSYNPRDDDHQKALLKAVKHLEKKKRDHERVVKFLTRGRDQKYNGSLSTDETWEEEVKERPEKKKKKTQKTVKEGVQEGDSNVAKKEEDKKKKRKKKDKKKVSKASLLATKKTLPHRRHPKRDIVLNEVDHIEEIAAQHAKREAKRQAAREKRRLIKREGMSIKSFGRHHYTPLSLDVAPSSNLVGSLRHLNGSSVHPITDRMKSLEERNLVPARMRHVYNKRKVLKPKGEVRVKRETFGVIPETSF